jgi:hypothetical protein
MISIDHHINYRPSLSSLMLIASPATGLLPEVDVLRCTGYGQACACLSVLTGHQGVNARPGITVMIMSIATRLGVEGGYWMMINR